MKYLFLLFFCIIHCCVNACDCNTIKGLDGAKAAFKGKVVKVTKVESEYRRYEITFTVVKRIKGMKRKKLIVIEVPCLEVGCCGVPFKNDEVYIVYAYGEESRLKTNLCWMPKKIK